MGKTAHEQKRANTVNMQWGMCLSGVVGRRIVQWSTEKEWFTLRLGKQPLGEWNEGMGKWLRLDAFVMISDYLCSCELGF